MTGQRLRMVRGAASAASGWTDTALALVVFAGVLGYLATLPVVMASPDEPHYLHEAKRILAGEVMYRDLFELTTPGWMYLMAGLFRLFGTTLHVARMTVAVIHACTAALVFLACRCLGVRRALAVGAGFAYLVISHPAYPVASQHWLASALAAALFVICLEWRGRVRWALAAGVVVGCLIAVHQQRGVSMGAGAVVIVVTDHFFLRRPRASVEWSALLKNLAALAGGALLVTLPFAVLLVAQAGIEPVWRALVVFPLTNYRNANTCPWGHWVDPAPRGVFPYLLKYSPAALPLALAGLCLGWFRSRDPDRLRLAVMVTVFAGSSLLSIFYYPDFIHIAFIAPVFVIILVGGIDWILRAFPERFDRGMGWACALLLFAAVGWRLQRNNPPLPARTVTYASAFGPIQMPRRAAMIYDRLEAIVRTTPSRTLYCHPLSWYTYLVLDAHNPTRFEYLIPRYHGREDVEEVIGVLQAGKVPYVLINKTLVAQDDAVYRFVRERYELDPDAGLWGDELWRRKSDDATGS